MMLNKTYLSIVISLILITACNGSDDKKAQQSILTHSVSSVETKHDIQHLPEQGVYTPNLGVTVEANLVSFSWQHVVEGSFYTVVIEHLNDRTITTYDTNAELRLDVVLMYDTSYRVYLEVFNDMNELIHTSDSIKLRTAKAEEVIGSDLAQ